MYAYDSSDLVQFHFNLSPGTTLCLGEDHCFLRKEGETEPDADHCTISTYRLNDDSHSAFSIRCSEEIWRPIRHLKPPELLLLPGLQLRFGRTRFVVSEVLLDSEFGTDNGAEEVSENPGDKICRICLSGEGDTANPLLTICKCAGTHKWIHLRCAEALIHSKLRTNDSSCVQSFLVSRSVQCDLCHEELPLTHSESGTHYTLRGVLKPQVAYVKLVSVSNPNEFHILHPCLGKVATIGRARSSDLKLHDPAVSRLHASVLHTQQGFLLKDEESKFGSHVKSFGDLSLAYQEDVTLQIRQTLITFHVVKPCKLLKCCCCPRRVNRPLPKPCEVHTEGKAVRSYEEDVPLDCPVP